MIPAAFSQQQQPSPPKPADAAQPFKETYKVRDFNYEFVPLAAYSNYSTVHTIDSASQKMIVKRDSAILVLQVIVEKDGDQLTLRGMTDPTAIHYREKIKYQGLSNDGSGTLIYQANTNGKETLYINPVVGYVVIGFNVCDQKYARTIADCDANYHYFGNVTPKKYMP